MTQFIDLQEPDQRVIYSGVGSISDIETLSLILSGLNATEKTKKLLVFVDYDLNKLARLSYSELISMGLSHLQAIRLVAVMEFCRRKNLQIANENPIIKCSKDIQDIFKPILQDLDHEEFWTLFLDRSNKVLKYERLSIGGLSGTVTDIRIVLKRALLLGASSIIICHNHPSGQNRPSESDSAITRKFKEAGAIMDITLLDHIIIANADYYSFADNGTL